jgi:hypothetical protein
VVTAVNSKDVESAYSNQAEAYVPNPVVSSQLAFTPASVSFGTVSDGSSGSQTVTLTDTGSASVVVSGETVTGTGFSTSGLSVPLTLAGGHRATFTVTFTPAGAGSVAGTVSMVSNASNSPTSLSLAGTGTKPTCSLCSVQAIANASSGSVNSLSLSFSQNTVAGDLILVAFDFDTNATPSSVTDAQGNVFTEVGSQLTSPGQNRSRVYCASNIKGGADTVTVNLSNPAYIELYLIEYTGVNRTNPIDAQAGASGNAGSVSSGNATTTVAGDLIFGYCVGDSVCTAGSGFTARSTFHSNLIEDMLAGNAGTYAATGSANSGWTMQMVALNP